MGWGGERAYDRLGTECPKMSHRRPRSSPHPPFPRALQRPPEDPNLNTGMFVFELGHYWVNTCLVAGGSTDRPPRTTSQPSGPQREVGECMTPTYIPTSPVPPTLDPWHPNMASLDTLPIEMFNEISSFACIDGGRTGSRLSQVCKAFQDVFSTTGIHIRHVSVSGVNKMDSFLKFLEKREMSARGVQSLMLVSSRGESSTLAIPLVKQILEAVSPHHLQNLTVSLPPQGDPDLMCPVLPVELPELTHLSISGCYDTQSFNDSFKAPKLLRLHIARYNPLPQDLLRQLTDFAPNMTHLKLSSLLSGTMQRSRLPEELKSFVQVQSTPKPMNRESDSSHMLLFPPTLQQIVIGFLPSYRPERMRCGFAFAWYRMAIDQFHELVQSFSSLGPDDSLIVLPQPGSTKAEDHGRDVEAALIFLEEEFMDRCRGDGAASWAKALYLANSGSLSPASM